MGLGLDSLPRTEGRDTDGVRQSAGAVLVSL